MRISRDAFRNTGQGGRFLPHCGTRNMPFISFSIKSYHPADEIGLYSKNLRGCFFTEPDRKILRLYK